MEDNTISYEDFLKVKICTGTIIKAEEFPEARRPAFKLWIDFGEDIGVKKSSAQITKHYNIDALQGQQVMAVVNFPAKQIGPFMSECLVLGFSDENGDIVLAAPGQPVPNGQKMH